MSGFNARTPASLRRYKAFRDMEERVKELSAQLDEKASDLEQLREEREWEAAGKQLEAQQAQKARDPREELGGILKLVEVAFRQAPAWNDPSVEIRQHHRQVKEGPGFNAVPKGPRTALPPDPFSIFGTMPEDPLSDNARLRTWLPMAEALALHAKTYGASGAEAVALTIEEGPTFEEQRTVKITATEVKA